MLIMGYVAQIGILFLIIGIFVTTFYTFLFFGHLEGQLARKVFNQE